MTLNATMNGKMASSAFERIFLFVFVWDTMMAVKVCRTVYVFVCSCATGDHEPSVLGRDSTELCWRSVFHACVSQTGGCFSFFTDLMELCSRRLIQECYTELFKYLYAIEFLRDVEKRRGNHLNHDSFLLLSGRDF